MTIAAAQYKLAPRATDDIAERSRKGASRRQELGCSQPETCLSLGMLRAASEQLPQRGEWAAHTRQ